MLGLSRSSDISARPFSTSKGTMVNNSDLADHIAGEHGIAKADARKVVDGVFAAIANAAGNGDEIALNRFGKFKVKDTPAREGRNPSTGETIQIAAAKRLTFAPAKAMKDKLNR
jgi:DNA-binding protein HU-beta